MCQDCGCGDPEIVPVEIHDKILAGNDRTAAHNREHLGAHGVLAINVMGPGGVGLPGRRPAHRQRMGGGGGRPHPGRRRAAG